MTEDRLIRIETTLAFQEKIIQELSDLAYQQQQELDAFKEDIVFLKSQSKRDSETETKTLEEERPPHY